MRIEYRTIRLKKKDKKQLIKFERKVEFGFSRWVTIWKRPRHRRANEPAWGQLGSVRAIGRLWPVKQKFSSRSTLVSRSPTVNIGVRWTERAHERASETDGAGFPMGRAERSELVISLSAAPLSRAWSPRAQTYLPCVPVHIMFLNTL